MFSCNDAAQVPAVTGQLLGPDVGSGHLLRPGAEKRPLRRSGQRKTEIVIVGGGIAGLACAWQLRQRGFHDFLLVEMEAETGGNARSGSHNGLQYPWGAHYLPVPDARNIPLMQFLQQIDVVQGFDAAQRPIFNELHLCHSPQERLQIHGIWQSSLVPHTGVPAAELAQIHRFFEEADAWKTRVGSDGKPAFTIPAEQSSQDPDILRLDGITMAAYLRERGFDAPHLRWYLDYCCRDDYGMPMEECSAWAGLHYFAARSGGGANAESGAVLTWPQGNAFLADKLRGDLEMGRQWLPRHMVTQLGDQGAGVHAVAMDLGQPGNAVEINARAAVFAGPQFVARHVVAGHKADLRTLDYAPWLVANLRVDLQGHRLLEGMHWDNVAYGRPSLGYVYAGHQSLAQGTPAEAVLTWYEPLTDRAPAEARKWLLAQDYAPLRDRVVADMEFMHRGIAAHIQQLDVWRWGHGMVRPVPGLITGAALAAARQPVGRIHFAHSDLSGISIFEEAFHRGIVAADAALAAIQS